MSRDFYYRALESLKKCSRGHKLRRHICYSSQIFMVTYTIPSLSFWLKSREIITNETQGKWKEEHNKEKRGNQ